MFYIWTEVVNKWKMVTWILSGYSLFFCSIFFFLLPRFPYPYSFPGGSDGKESACNAEGARDSASIPGLGRSAGEGMATHSSILAWRSPWTEEPCGLQSMGSQRVRHNSATISFTFIPFLPLESMAYWFFSWPKCFFLTKNVNIGHWCQSSSSEVWISEWRGAVFHL